MGMHQSRSHRERLVSHVQNLERLEALKKLAADDFKEGLQAAKAEGFDAPTLKVVLKLRKMTPLQRSERKAHRWSGSRCGGTCAARSRA